MKMALDMDMAKDIKKKVDEMLPNIAESIGEFIDDELDEHVFANEEFSEVSWDNKIKIVNYMLMKIKEMV